VDDGAYLAEQGRLWRREGPAGLSMRAALPALIKHPRIDAVARGAAVTDTRPLLALDLYSAQLQARGVGVGCWLSLPRVHEGVCVCVCVCHGLQSASMHARKCCCSCHRPTRAHTHNDTNRTWA
jgi:hypothetical protein